MEGEGWEILVDSEEQRQGLPFASAGLTRCFRECVVWLLSPFLPALCVCPSDINTKLLKGRNVSTPLSTRTSASMRGGRLEPVRKSWFNTCFCGKNDEKILKVTNLQGKGEEENTRC